MTDKTKFYILVIILLISIIVAIVALTTVGSNFTDQF